MTWASIVIGQTQRINGARTASMHLIAEPALSL